MKSQLVKITRPDASVFYLDRITNNDGSVDYAPVGGGFVRKGLDSSLTVEEVDALPDNKVLGYCSIDGGERLKCVCNPRDRWNGWAKPFIFESELPKFLKPFEGDDYYKVTMDGTTIVVRNVEEEEDERIELINGFYNIGLMGFCWDFETEEEYQQQLIEDNEN